MISPGTLITRIYSGTFYQIHGRFSFVVDPAQRSDLTRVRPLRRSLITAGRDVALMKTGSLF